MKKFTDFKDQIHQQVNKIDVLEQVYLLFDQLDEARKDDDLSSVSHLIAKVTKIIMDNFDSGDGIHKELEHRIDDVEHADYNELAKLKYRSVGMNEVFRHGGSWFKKIRMKEFVNVETSKRHFATHDMPDFFVSIDESDRMGETRFGWVNEDLCEAGYYANLNKVRGYKLMQPGGKTPDKRGEYYGHDPVTFKSEAKANAEAAKRNKTIKDKSKHWFVLTQGGHPDILKKQYNIEDAPANAVGAPPGNIAGVSDNDPPIDNRKKKKVTTVARRKVSEDCDTFAGGNVFDVDADTFQKCRMGRLKYSRWNKYLDDSTDVGSNIKQYSQRNPSSAVILRDEKTKVMMYLQRAS
jgi:hypothetical protein